MGPLLVQRFSWIRVHNFYKKLTEISIIEEEYNRSYLAFILILIFWYLKTQGMQVLHSSNLPFIKGGGVRFF